MGNIFHSVPPSYRHHKHGGPFPFLVHAVYARLNIVFNSKYELKRKNTSHPSFPKVFLPNFPSSREQISCKEKYAPGESWLALGISSNDSLINRQVVCFCVRHSMATLFRIAKISIIDSK